jgi:lipoprotein-anchoring transpeptidase ErfK/SrfK
MSDNSWLYLKASDGQEGWINKSFINLDGIDLDTQPIKTPIPYPETIVKVSGDPVNLRTGPGTVFPKARKLKYNESLKVLGRFSDYKWLFVETSDGLQGWVETNQLELGWFSVYYHDRPVLTSPPTPTTTPVILPGVEGHWIDIDLSDQMLYAYDGAERKAAFVVSTGVRDFPTEPGQYHIQVKYRYADMHGSDYFLPDVPYTMYYDGDFAIHGTYWHHNFGTPMSRGCVNLDPGDSAWMYNFSEVGTLVNIHR